MTTSDTYEQARTDLNEWANAATWGAATAPMLALGANAALRDILTRHQPVDIGSGIRCAHCRVSWPCSDASDVLKSLSLPEKDEDEDEF